MLTLFKRLHARVRRAYIERRIAWAEQDATYIEADLLTGRARLSATRQFIDDLRAQAHQLSREGGAA